VPNWDHLLLYLRIVDGTQRVMYICVYVCILGCLSISPTFDIVRDFLCSQMIGYGWAGIFQGYLVKPAHMWWPANLVQVSLFRYQLVITSPRLQILATSTWILGRRQVWRGGEGEAQILSGIHVMRLGCFMNCMVCVCVQNYAWERCTGKRWLNPLSIFSHSSHMQLLLLCDAWLPV